MIKECSGRHLSLSVFQVLRVVTPYYQRFYIAWIGATGIQLFLFILAGGHCACSKLLHHVGNTGICTVITESLVNMSNMDRTCKAGWCLIANIAPIMSIICKSLIRLIKHSYCQPPALWPIEDMLECLSMPTPLTSSHPISRWSCGWCSWRGKWSGRGPLPETVHQWGHDLSADLLF